MHCRLTAIKIHRWTMCSNKVMNPDINASLSQSRFVARKTHSSGLNPLCFSSLHMLVQRRPRDSIHNPLFMQVVPEAPSSKLDQ